LWLGSKIILSGTRDSLKKDTFLLRGRGLCLAFFNLKNRASRKTVIYKCKIEENSLTQTDPSATLMDFQQMVTSMQLAATQYKDKRRVGHGKPSEFLKQPRGSTSL
jgi:hypothetical protein